MKRVCWLVLANMACGSSGGPETPAAAEGPLGCMDPHEAAAAITSPTGVLASAADAQGVAAAFGELLDQVVIAGQRRSGIACPAPQTGEVVTCDCSEGGTVDIVVDDVELTSARYAFRECCYEGCCFDGCGRFAVSTGGDLTCLSMSMTNSCADSSLIDATYCLDSSDQQWFLVAYEGRSFAVAGYYMAADGGNWTVRDAETEWSCSEESGSGSCTDGTNTLSW